MEVLGRGYGADLDTCVCEWSVSLQTSNQVEITLHPDLHPYFGDYLALSRQNPCLMKLKGFERQSPAFGCKVRLS